MSAALRIEVLSWLKDRVFPLWSQVGVQPKTCLFTESLTFDQKPQMIPMRGIVQARQIYSFAEGLRLNVIDKNKAQNIIHAAAKSFVQYYQLSDGSFLHSVDPEGKPHNLDLDLYTQAFALFGLAHAYQQTQDIVFKTAAERLMNYLIKERTHSSGGFTEIKNQKILFQSNPHMHLFEAVLAWAKFDTHPMWSEAAQNIKKLCLEKFIDSSTGILGEHFDERWHLIRNEKNHFIFEPGHQYEWAWLLNWFSRDLYQTSMQLFQNGEKYGLSADKTLALDEIWSNHEVNKSSSRFWPQTERIKAAIVMKDQKVADIAMQSLRDNFLLMEDGLWRDILLEKGQYGDLPAKGSSLYHIINAISEYVSE